MGGPKIRDIFTSGFMKRKVIVVMPAYNAERTLEATCKDIPEGSVDEIIVVDDHSADRTVEVAKGLGLTIIQHDHNCGYGRNQKTCYVEALKRGADVVIMIHPDYQYDSSLTEELIRPIARERFDIMFGGRVRTRQEALAGGMPKIKYFLNRTVTLIENIVLGVNFTEHMSGFRAYSSRVLKTLPFENFSDDFVFDQQFMISAIAYGFRIAEYPVPVRYFSEASSIRYLKGAKFLCDTFVCLGKYVAYRSQVYRPKIFAYKSLQTTLVQSPDRCSLLMKK
jgi:glycosyltransferase involved in cell wall biosynthesis